MGAALVALALLVAAPLAHAGVSLLANGGAGTVQVSPGQTVTLTVNATNCAAVTADEWRDTWTDPGGIGVPNPGQTLDANSPCQRSPARTFTVPNTPGSSYVVTFQSDSCRLFFFGNCYGSGWATFDSSTVTIQVASAAYVGTGTGLTGAYCNRDGTNYDTPCTTNPDVTRVDATVDFNDGDAGWPAGGIGADTFSVRWTGQIQAQYTEDYRIHTISDDGIRVWVDGNLVIDDYNDHSATEDASATIPMARGQKYDIVIEYYENGGQQDARLLWSSPSTAPQTSPVVVPQTQLYPAQGVAANLLAEYRMDESSWNGTTNEVADHSGNGRDGTASNGAQTAGTNPAIAGDPGTCRYGMFDGADDYVQVGNLSAILNGTASLGFWIRTTQTGNDTAWQAPGVTGVEESGGADDIFWGWIDAGGHIGISVGNDYATDQRSATAINDGAWHYVVLTRNAGTGDTRVYVDGNLERSGTTGTGTIGNAYSSIGRIEDTGGSPEYFAGQLDEVRVYDAVLSQSDVQSMYNATHACPSGGAVAYYPLDELSYNGSAGEVRDASGNGHDGTTVGNVTAYPESDPDIKVCSGANVADNNSAGVIDAIDTGVDLDSDVGNQGTIDFWYWSPTRWRQLNYDRMLLDASEIPNNPGSKYFYLMLLDAQNSGGPGGRGARLHFELEDSSDANHAVETSRIDIDRNTWTHIAVTWDLSAQELQIFVNGALAQSATITSTGALGNLESLYLGDNRGNYQVAPMTGNSANGRFDEARVYNRVLSQSEIAADRDATHPCGGGIDHFVIGHDGAGINCRTEPVTLTAVDALGNTVTDYAGTVDLSTSTGNGDWSVNTAGGALAGGTGDDGAATYTFVAGDNGQVVLDLRDTHQESVNINASDGAASDDDTEGNLVFRPYGFELTPNPIPTEVAGRAFDITLTAVGELPSDPQCGVIEEYTGSKDLRFWFDYDDPASGSRVVQVAGTSIAATQAGSSNQAVAFNNGVATVPVVYADAGRIQLHARDDSGVGEPPAGSGDEIVAGGTAPFVVRPFGLDVEVPSDTSGTGPTGAVLARAGVDFTATVTARAWQAADDTNGDGVPDSGADLSDNVATPNFGNESAPEAVALSPTVAAPAAGANGALTNALFDAFANGAQTRTDLQWNEAGYVDLAAALADGDYLGSAQDVTGAAAMVGRFIPDRFAFAAGSLTNRADLACGSAPGFTYIGERFDGAFTLTARAAGGSTTANYEGTYARLDTAGELGAGATDGATDLSAALLTNAASFAWNNGVGSVATQFAYARGTPEGPHDPFHVGIAPADDDGVQLAAAARDLDVNVNGTDDHAEVGQTALRYGRLAIDNAGGAEVAPIGQPVRAEYWDGNTWRGNADDGCTGVALPADVRLANAAGTTVAGDQPIQVDGDTTRITTATPVTLAAGQATLTFSPLAAGNTGWVDTTLLLAGRYPYLRGDWNGDGSWADNPSGRVTFGIYGGNSRWIDIRRVPVN